MPGDVVVNQWLANDLSAQVGDSLTLYFYEIGPLRELTESSKTFRIARIETLSGYFSDRLLKPGDVGH